jgi:hypothetical protein
MIKSRKCIRIFTNNMYILQETGNFSFALKFLHDSTLTH